MALLARTTASFDAIKPVPDLVKLDNEFNQLVGSNGALNGGSTGNRVLTKYSHATEPVLELDQLGAGPIQIWKKSGTARTTLDNVGNLLISHGDNPGFLITNTDASKQVSGIVSDAGALVVASAAGNIFTVDLTSKILTFLQQPVLPNDKTRWAANFFIQDPSTFPTNSFNLVQKALIPGTALTVKQFGAIFSTGTASGSFTIELRKHPFADQTTQTTLGTVTFNSGTLGVGVNVDIVDHTFNEGDWLYPILTARSSPAQRDISIFTLGYQTFVST